MPLLWPLVSSLHAGYMQVANIYRHLGMIRESIFFVGEALKTVEAVEAKPAVSWTKVVLGDLMIRCGDITEGSEILEKVRQSIDGSRTTIDLEVATGNLEKLNGDFESEIGAYQRAEKAIDDLLAHALQKSAKAGETQELAGQYASPLPLS